MSATSDKLGYSLLSLLLCESLKDSGSLLLTLLIQMNFCDLLRESKKLAPELIKSFHDSLNELNQVQFTNTYTSLPLMVENVIFHKKSALDYGLILGNTLKCIDCYIQTCLSDPNFDLIFQPLLKPLTSLNEKQPSTLGNKIIDQLSNVTPKTQKFEFIKENIVKIKELEPKIRTFDYSNKTTDSKALKKSVKV